MNASARLALPGGWRAQRNAWRARWKARPASERRAVGIAAALVGLLLLWLVAVQPALSTLRTAPAQLATLEQQLQRMRALASEAQALRAAPALSADQSTQALRAASERLGDKGRLSLQGERAVLTLSGASSEQLREWLAETRSGARARVVEAQLSRTSAGFSGSIVLALGGGS
jgi:general secretion pathway protein M